MADLNAVSERRWREAVLEHARVVSALMLRDIKTRAGASYFGFLVGMFIPLAHIGLVLIVYIFLGRRAPIGTDVTLYLSTAIVPFVVWSYTHQKIMQSFEQNRALTAFPVVKLNDILIARSFVELLNGVLIVFIVYVVLYMTVPDFFMSNYAFVTYALFLSYALGVSTGFLFGLFSILNPTVLIIGFVIIPLYWVTSGVFFIPDALPEQVKAILVIFPLSHVVDFGRVAFYPSYLSNYSNLVYVHAVIIGNVLIGLALERFLRPVLSAK